MQADHMRFALSQPVLDFYICFPFKYKCSCRCSLFIRLEYKCPAVPNIETLSHWSTGTKEHPELVDHGRKSRRNEAAAPPAVIAMRGASSHLSPKTHCPDGVPRNHRKKGCGRGIRLLSRLTLPLSWQTRSRCPCLSWWMVEFYYRPVIFLLLFARVQQRR